MKVFAKIVLRALLYFLYIMVIIAAFSIVTGLVLSLFERCNSVEAKAEGAKIVNWWICEAKMPFGYEQYETYASRKSLDSAKKAAVAFCNEMFKSNKCIAGNCEFNSRVLSNSKTEWKCKASPPPSGTRFEKDIEILAFHEERNKAEKNAIWFCNKIFKTNKCKIDSCKQVKIR